MKNAIINDYFFESEIRPQSLYEEWKRILQQELESTFPMIESLDLVDCTGCSSTDTEFYAEIWRFPYRKCSSCGSVFASRRPNKLQLKEFYRDSKAVIFWREKMIPTTALSRTQHYLLPMYTWMMYFINSYQANSNLVVVEYKPKFRTAFFGITESLKDKKSVHYLVEPLKLLKDSAVPDSVLVNNLGEVMERVDIVTVFDVIDRENSPIDLINELSEKIKTGGLLFLTTNTISGFEYITLHKHSERLVPPDRLNMLSIESLKKIFDNAGFEILELSTPGKLDIEIVRNTYKKNKDVVLSDFLKYMFESRDETVWQSFQDFLRLNNLSSSLRMVAKKK